MKDNTFKWVSKFFITLGIIYWLCLILAATGCQTYEYDVKNKSHKTYEDIDKRLLELWLESDKYKNPNETTINLDPMDKTQWHEREEFLRQFGY
tara:strand:+ start:836 stop:1117 length:282 start_codon:yes stop_codon:yes gene_type:complete